MPNQTTAFVAHKFKTNEEGVKVLDGEVMARDIDGAIQKYSASGWKHQNTTPISSGVIILFQKG